MNNFQEKRKLSEHYEENFTYTVNCVGEVCIKPDNSNSFKSNSLFNDDFFAKLREFRILKKKKNRDDVIERRKRWEQLPADERLRQLNNILFIM
jgi:siroheme synthase (precorrin-2 oxidase/ferrochelatase)